MYFVLKRVTVFEFNWIIIIIIGKDTVSFEDTFCVRECD
jgi:hypothetical protein